MRAIDWIIVFAYAVSTIGLGWYFGKRQTSNKEYFVGSGKMSPLLVGVSLFATLLSTISYLAIPGETLSKGPVYLSNLAIYPVVFLVVGFVILPVYMRQRVTSAYELLDSTLGPSIRMLGVTMFMMLRLVWMAVLVSMTADALQAVLGVDEKWVPLIAIVTGAFAIAYASIGGMRAVVVTDLMQTLLLYGGALLVILTVTIKMQGFGWFPTQWQDDIWDDQPFFSLDPSVRVTVVGSLVTTFLWMVCTSMGDQVTVQRFMCTEDASAARKAVGMQLFVGAVVGITLGFVGVALLGFYQANPDQLPAGKTLAEHGDKAFSYFIAGQLPPVISGLVVSGLFAAAMSSVDSGVNSITAVTQTDILPRVGKVPESDQAKMRFSRRLAVGIGVTVVLLSFLRDLVPGNFMQITQTTVNLLTVPISILFIFALFVPFANARGVWIGTLASIFAAVLIAFNGPIFGYKPAAPFAYADAAIDQITSTSNDGESSGTFDLSEPWQVEDQPFSLAVWVKPEKVSESGILCAAGASRQGWVLDCQATGSIRFVTLPSQPDTAGLFSPEGTLVEGNWSHVALTVDAARKARLFVNAKEVANTEIGTRNLSNRDAQLVVGAIEGQSESRFQGTIERIGIWKKELSSTEIAALAAPQLAHVSFQWMTLAALVAGLVVGVLACLAFRQTAMPTGVADEV